MALFGTATFFETFKIHFSLCFLDTSPQRIPPKAQKMIFGTVIFIKTVFLVLRKLRIIESLNVILLQVPFLLANLG